VGQREMARTDISCDGGLAVVALGLRGRRSEIELAFEGLCIGPRPTGLDPEFCAGMRSGFSGLITYAAECLEIGDAAVPPVPSTAIAQVRRAAREGVELDAVLMALIKAHGLLSDFAFREARELPLSGWRRVQILHGAILGKLTSSLARAYRQEARRSDNLSARRRVEVVERLLVGDPVVQADLDYTLDAWHVGLIVHGRQAVPAVRALGEMVGGALLYVPRGAGTVWAWVGSRQEISVDRIERVLAKHAKDEMETAVGEPGRSVSGWRSTHFEARAARAVALRRPQAVTCFAHVALEAIALQTPDLARAVQAIFLDRLDNRSGGGERFRQTLRAYFAAGHNASAAADALEVTRRTVENRIQVIEEELGSPLTHYGAELEFALRLDGLLESPDSV
jgi:hypothetical protein